MEATTLWEAYQEQGDEQAREKLLARHLALVHHVARKIARTLSVEVELSDLISAGAMGLINAIDNFDPDRGLAFSTFAAPRIRGAILDDLRRCDHVPRSIRRKQKQITAARDAVAGRLERTPDDRDIAEHIGIPLATLWRWRIDTEEAVQVSIDQPTRTAEGRSASPAELIEGSNGEDFELGLNTEQEVDVLRDEILNLKERERVVLTLYYYEELKLHEIATVLGLTESRISQIRTRALINLRARMGHLREAS